MEVDNDDIENILNGDLDLQIIEDKNNESNEPEENEAQSINSAVTVKIVRKNPVEEHLSMQLHRIQNQIDQINSNIEVMKNVTDNTLKTVAARTVYKDESSSESDDDLYTTEGTPVIKKRRRNNFYEKVKVLEVNSTWQRIVNKKWIIGIELESKTTCSLREPTIYLYQKDGKNSYHGVSVFWSYVENKFWFPTEEIESHEKLVATAVLDLPTFDETSVVEAVGTIFCEFEGKLFQTPLPSSIKLSVENIVDSKLSINLNETKEAIQSLLALKVLSVDRMVTIPASTDTAQGLLKFFEKYEFQEVCNVCISNSSGLLKNCVLEILSTDCYLRIFISATCEAQLSAIIQLMRQDFFPDLSDSEREDNITEAVKALHQELTLYLTCNNPAQIQSARVTSDLLIP